MLSYFARYLPIFLNGRLEEIIAKVNLLRMSLCKGEVNFLNKFKYKIHFHREKVII